MTKIKCPYCKQEFEKPEFPRTDMSGRDICEKCFKNFRMILGGLAQIGGRTLV